MACVQRVEEPLALLPEQAMIRAILITLSIVHAATSCIGQNVGINANGAAPNASALLDIDGSAIVGPKRGLLIPRVTTTERLGIVAPATGLLVFDTSFLEFWFFDGLVWVPLNNGRAWRTSGNAGIVGGTHFIGTTDAARLDFRVNNEPSGHLGHFLRSTAFGYRSGASIVSGQRNTLIGAHAGELCTTGSYNTAVGSHSLETNTTGSSNVGIGVFCLQNSTTGSGNTAVGNESLTSNTTGYRNSAVGESALLDNTTGAYNVALGSSALANNTTGNDNTAIGSGAGDQNITGNGNVAIGHQSGPVWSGLQNTTNLGPQCYTYADNAVAVGYVAQAEGGNSMALGYGSRAVGANSTAIGQTALALSPNSLVLGGTGANAVSVGIGVSAPSATLEVNGYTKLGSDAPAIRTKKITVNTPTSQGAVLWIPHGVIGNRILSVQLMVEYAAGQFVPDNYAFTGYYLRWTITGANIAVETVAASSANVLNKPMKVFITYEQ